MQYLLWIFAILVAQVALCELSINETHEGVSENGASASVTMEVPGHVQEHEDLDSHDLVRDVVAEHADMHDDTNEEVIVSPPSAHDDPVTQPPQTVEEPKEKEHVQTGPFSKPRSSLKEVDHSSPTSYKEGARQRQYAAPAPNQGAYYATPGTPGPKPDSSHTEKRAHSTSATQGVSGTKKTSLLADLATKLNKRISLDQSRRRQEEKARLQRQRRFSISREYAAPVERVLEAYNDPHTNLYDVLGVRRDISDAALRKAYRSQALDIHPGKCSDELCSMSR